MSINKIATAIVISAALMSVANAQKTRTTTPAYHPAPAQHSAPAYHPAPQRSAPQQPYRPAPQPYHPAPAPQQPYRPAPQPYHSAPQPYHPAPQPQRPIPSQPYRPIPSHNPTTGHGPQTGPTIHPVRSGGGYGNAPAVATHSNPYGALRPGRGTYGGNRPTVATNTIRTNHAPGLFGNHGRVPASGGWRNGYVAPAAGFHFGLYVATPGVGVVFSPWYYYPSLPAYIPEERVIVQGDVACDWDSGDAYTLGNSDALDEAVARINSIYLSKDQSAINALVGDGSQIAIFGEGDYMYSLTGDDFRQMLSDCALDANTTSFQVNSVKTDGSKATVDCAHSFATDNGVQTVYLRYELSNSGDEYCVSDFETSQSPLG